MKKHYRYLFLIIFAFCGLSTKSWAQLGGSSTYNFLKLPVSARAEALGGSIVSMYDNDLSAAFTNPSLLNKHMNHNMQLSFNSYFANIGQGFAGYARHWEKVGTFVAGLQFLNYGDFTRADEYGNIHGTFSAGDYALSVGYSRPFFDSLLYVGVTNKWILSQYAEYTSFGTAFDLGASYVSKNKLFTASVVFRNMGFQMKSYTANNQERLPFEIQLGISQGFKHVPLRLMLFVTNLQRPDLSYYDAENRFTVNPIAPEDTIDTKIGLGTNILRHFTVAVELFPFKKHLFLRLAYNFQRAGELTTDVRGKTAGLSYGIGIRIANLTFSYSRSHYFVLESPNHITLNIDLGGFNKFKKKNKPVPLENTPEIAP